MIRLSGGIALGLSIGLLLGVLLSGIDPVVWLSAMAITSLYSWWSLSVYQPARIWRFKVLSQHDHELYKRLEYKRLETLHLSSVRTSGTVEQPSTLPTVNLQGRMSGQAITPGREPEESSRFTQFIED